MKTALPTLLIMLLSACDTHQPMPAVGSEIFPPRSIEGAALWQLHGLGINAAFFRERWSLVMVDEAECLQLCLQRLELLAAIDDVQRLYVAFGAATHQQLTAIADRAPGIEVAMGTTAAAIDSFRRQLCGEDLMAGEAASVIYVVSPDAEAVYSYPGNGAKESLLHELRQLQRQYRQQ